MKYRCPDVPPIESGDGGGGAGAVGVAALPSGRRSGDGEFPLDAVDRPRNGAGAARGALRRRPLQSARVHAPSRGRLRTAPVLGQERHRQAERTLRLQHRQRG